MMPTPSPPATLVKPGIVSQPENEHKRGAKKGVKRGPSRPPEIVFRGKMESTFKSANRLLEKLVALRDSRQVRNDEEAMKKYVAFLTKLGGKIQECVPASTVSKSESLDSWLA